MWPRPDRPYLGIFVARQVAGLRNAGIEVTVETVKPNSGASRLAYFRAALRVLALNFGPHKFDIVHGHSGHCGVLACFQVRYPVVFTYYGYDLDVPAEDNENARTKVERILFRRMSCFVAATIAMSRRGQAKLPHTGRSRNLVIPNGVDRELFAPIARDEARRRLGWDHHRPVVLFPADPSRFTKNFGLARAAVELVRQRSSDVELAIGDGVPVDEMPLWMNASDVLLLTSVAEGSPNVIKEAMACDLPIVSVDVGDVRDNVDGTRNCHICAHDPHQLAAALLDIISRIPERSDGRERSIGLGLEAVTAAITEVYARALLRGPGAFGAVRRRRNR
jgi:glycosyltransferase involved in cell wall biosynthesis